MGFERMFWDISLFFSFSKKKKVNLLKKKEEKKTRWSGCEAENTGV